MLRPIAGFLLITSMLCLRAFPQNDAARAPVVARPAGGGLMLREGVDVPLKFGEPLTSKTAIDGDPVTFSLAENISVGGVVVARAGAKALGEISNAKKAGMLGRPGDLNVRLKYLKVGDNRIALRGVKGREGDGRVGSTVALTVLLGPIGLIKHGKNIEIKEGTPLLAYVAEDIAVPPAPPGS